MKIGLSVYLWVTESLCTLCTDMEQPPRSAKWEKERYKTVHSLFCTEGVGGERPPTRVYIWLSGRFFCSGYTGLNSFHSTPALLRIGPFLESTSPLSKQGLQGLGLFRRLRRLMPQPIVSRRPTAAPELHLSFCSSSQETSSQNTGSPCPRAGAGSTPHVPLWQVIYILWSHVSIKWLLVYQCTRDLKTAPYPG